MAPPSCHVQTLLHFQEPGGKDRQGHQEEVRRAGEGEDAGKGGRSGEQPNAGKVVMPKYLVLYSQRLMEYRCSPLTSPIVTMVVGRDRRLFAAHEDVLSIAPYFRVALKEDCMEDDGKQLALPDE